ALYRPQAAQPPGEGPGADAGGDRGRLPADDLRGDSRGGREGARCLHVVRSAFHCDAGKRRKVKSSSPASSKLATTGAQRRRHFLLSPDRDLGEEVADPEARERGSAVVDEDGRGQVEIELLLHAEG